MSRGHDIVDLRDCSSISVIISTTWHTYQVHRRDSDCMGLGEVQKRLL